MATSPLSKLFSAVFMVLCGVLFAAGGWFAVLGPELRAMKEFKETTCVLLDKHLAINTGSKGKKTYRPDFRIKYAVDGRDYETVTYDIARITGGQHWSQQTLDQFEVGKEYPCWYDPADPKVAVLHLGTTSLGWILISVGGGLIVIGIGCLLWFVASAFLGPSIGSESTTFDPAA